MGIFDKAAQDVAKFAGDAVSTVGKAASDVGGFVGKTATDVGDFIGKTASGVGGVVGRKKDDAMKALDVNGDGTVDITDIIILALRTPGIRIDRAAFLRNELKKNHTEEVVADAIEYNPLHAGILPEETDKIANAVIAYERNYVTGISAALGTPGGAAMVATIPADIIQYYGYTLRAAQKLMYLYGFPEITTDAEDVCLDTETINELILCLGAMNGVAGASNAIKAMAKMLGSGVQKQLMKKALTKGAIYPVVKSVAKWFGVRMTKSMFTGFFGKAIPVVGGVIGGAITYASFGPCCSRLAATLRDTALSSRDYREDAESEKIYTEFTEETKE